MNKMMMLVGFSIMMACGEKETDTAGDVALEDAAAVELWSEVQGFEGWNQYEGWEGIVPSESVHGDFVQIWLNDEAMTAISAGDAIPDGAILLKETFNDAEGTDLKDITVMKKVAGYNADGSDWYWAQYLEDGSVQTSGAPTMCTGCHASGDDYVRFTGE